MSDEPDPQPDPRPWTQLPMPLADEIEDARAWLGSVPSRAVPGYYLVGLEGADHDEWTAEDFCERHARSTARKLRRTSPEVSIALAVGNLDGVDGEYWCSAERCRRQLSMGRLSDYGIDSALGITEEDPLDVALSIEGMSAAAESMDPTDKRWRLWAFHVDHMRARQAAGRRVP